MSPGIPPGCLIEANRIPQFRICSTWVWGKSAQKASIPAFSRKNRAWAAASPAGGKQPVLQFVNRSAELAGSGSTAPLVLSRSRLPDGLCDVPSCFPIQRPPFTARDRQGVRHIFRLTLLFRGQPIPAEKRARPRVFDRPLADWIANPYKECRRFVPPAEMHHRDRRLAAEDRWDCRNS